MTIKIKPENKGKFNATKKKTGKSTEELTHSKNPVTKKRAIFAQNAAKWNHKQLGGTIGKFDDGGQNWTNLSPTDQNAGIGSQFSAPSVNNTQMPSYQTSQNSSVTPSAPTNFQNFSSEKQSKTSGISASQIGGYVGQAANAVSPLWEGTQYYKAPENNTTHQVFSGIKAGASNIPVAGPFIQAGTTIGQGFDTGANKAISNITHHKGNNLTNEAGAGAMHFFKGMSDPISNYETIDKLRKMGKLSTGQAVGYGLTHLVGGPGVSEAVLQKKFRKELHPDLYPQKIEDTQNSFNQQTDNSLLKNLNNNPVTAQNGLRGMSKYANGGDSQLEQYNTGLHKDMPNSFANAQLKGKDGVTTPIQLQRKENIYRFKDGGDYVFTDNLMNPETGNLFSKDANKVIKTSQKPFLDEASTKVINHNMKGLSKINDKVRDEVEQKKLGGKIDFPMYAKNGLHGSYNVDGTYEQPSFIGTGGKIDALLNQEQPINYTNFQDNNGKSNLNVDLTTNNGLGTRFITNTPKLNPRPIATTPQDKQGNNLTTGDVTKLIGGIAPLAYNTAMALKKPEKFKAHLDNTQYSDPRIAKDFNPIYLAENSAAQDIDKGSLSDSVRRAARVSLAGNTQQNLANYSLAVDNQNKGLQFQRDQALAGTNKFNAQMLTVNDDANARARAGQRMFGAEAASNFDTLANRFGEAKNQELSNKIGLSALNEIAADYGLDVKTVQDLQKKGVQFKYKGKIV